MSGSPKFLIAEKDGVELAYNEEYEPLSDDIYFDSNKTERIKDKLDEINEGYGTNFKYSLTEDYTVPTGRSKIITSEIELNAFCLIVEGILEIA